MKSRLAKDEMKVEAMRKAAEIADLGVEAVMENVKEGVSDIELTASAELAMRRAGAHGSWFFHGFGHVGFGPAIADRPPGEYVGFGPSERKLRRGEIISMDLTPLYMGYAGDIARTFVFGRPSREQKEALSLVRDILDAETSHPKGGMTVRELKEATPEPIKNHRLGKYLVALGHGIGLYDEGYPILWTPNSTKL